MAKVCLFKNIPLNREYSDIVNFRDMGANVNKVTLSDMFKYYDPNKYSSTGSSISYIKCNFQIGDVLTTSLVLPISSENLDSNYLHVVFEGNEGIGDKKQAFYFITDIQQYNVGTYKLSLELDVMTTYNDTLSFSTLVETERKHCYRFTRKLVGDTVRLYSTDALLGDDIDKSFEANIVTSKQTIPLYSHYNDKPTFKDKMSKVMWMYVFVKPDVEYSIIQNNQASIPAYLETPLSSTTINDINLSYKVVVFPMGIDLEINTFDPTRETWSLKKVDFNTFMKFINTEQNIVCIKLSNVSPFKESVLYSAYNDGDKSLEFYNLPDYQTYKNYDNYAMYYTTRDTMEPIICFNKVYNDPFEIDLTLYASGLSVYNVSDLLTTNYKNINLEPKLYTSPYFYQGIKNSYTNLFNFNLFAYVSSTSQNPITCVRHGLTLANENVETYLYDGPGLVSFNPTTNIGASYSLPCDLPFVIDAYKQAIATTKNSMNMGILSSFVPSAGNIAQILNGDVSYFIKPAMTIASTCAKLGDLKNTPDTMASLGSNIIYNASYQGDLTPYYVTVEMTPKDKETVYDYFYNNGYRVDRMCEFNLDSYFTQDEIISNNDNKELNKIINRRLFNYVKLSDTSLVSKMNFNAPYVVKVQIANVLSRGCKIWVLATSDYNEAIVRHRKFEYFLTEEYENIEYIE